MDFPAVGGIQAEMQPHCLAQRLQFGDSVLDQQFQVLRLPAQRHRPGIKPARLQQRVGQRRNLFQLGTAAGRFGRRGARRRFQFFQQQVCHRQRRLDLVVDVLGKPVGIGGLSAGRFQVCGLARYPGIDRLPQCLGTLRRRGKVGPVQPGNQGCFQCLPPFFGCVSAPKCKGGNPGAKSSCHYRHQPEPAV